MISNAVFVATTSGFIWATLQAPVAVTKDLIRHCKCVVAGVSIPSLMRTQAVVMER